MAAAARSTTSTATCWCACGPSSTGAVIDTPLLWGNRNSEPFFADAVHAALDLGAVRVVTLLTSAYSCYSSCRQYREDLAAAVEAVGPAADGLVVDKVRPYAVHPGVGLAWRRALLEAVRSLPDPASARLLYVTHSVPEAMDDTSGPGDGEGNLYTDQHVRLAVRLTDEVNAELGLELEGELVFCSRSGPPTQPWLEPDVNDRIEELGARGGVTVVCAPIGFVSDHMEVVHDLDTEAAETAERVGVPFVRVVTPGTDDLFVEGLVDLLLERAAEARGEVVVPEHLAARRRASLGLRAGLLPQPAHREAGAVRERLMAPASGLPHGVDAGELEQVACRVARAAGRLVVDERPADLARRVEVDRHRPGDGDGPAQPGAHHPAARAGATR